MAAEEELGLICDRPMEIVSPWQGYYLWLGMAAIILDHVFIQSMVLAVLAWVTLAESRR